MPQSSGTSQPNSGHLSSSEGPGGPEPTEVPYPADAPEAGEVYWVNLDPVVGSEQRGRRPALVISPKEVQVVLPVVVVAAITSVVRSYDNPLTPVLPAGHPLPKESTVLTFQIRTLDQRRLEAFAGRLTAVQMAAVRRGLIRSFGLSMG